MVDGNDPRTMWQAQEHLREALSQAELAARTAVTALLNGLPHAKGNADARGNANADSNASADSIADSIDVMGQRIAILVDYIDTCADPFIVLDLARLMRAMTDDMTSSAYSRGSLTECARAELRITALAARVSRTLRDERALMAEQALIDLAVAHLRALEESPRYSEILAEMARIQDSSDIVSSRSPVEEFFGLARGEVVLPTQPPPDPDAP